MRLEIPTAFHVRVEWVSKTDMANINNKLDQIIMKVSELQGVVTQVKDQLAKAADEITAKIAQLQSTDPDISPEGQAVIDELKAKAQALDDIVPDAATEPPSQG
jgi:uncharacterized phage infection (PIP) family protein YhgE